MQTEFITVKEYCYHHHADFAFIEALEQSGLIELTLLEQERHIPYDQLHDLECFTRWHYELEINLEGIEALRHMLQKLREAQDYSHGLEQKLKQYEE